MSDVHGAAPAGGENQAAEAPDNGLTAEENAQFADMQRETSAPPASDAPVSDAPAGGEPAPADGAKPAVGEPAAADDDDDDEPAAAPGAAPAPGADGRTPRRVSFSKYKRETEALQAKVSSLEATDRERAQAQARLDERLKIINEALTAPAATQPEKKQPPLPTAEDDPEPDIETDIFAWAAWQKRDGARFRQEFQQSREATQQEKQTEQAERETNTTYMHDAEAYAGHEPNFVPAYQFLMGSRVAELAVHYFGKDLSVEGQKLTQQEYNRISQTIIAEEKTIVEGALKAGRSPAAQLYAIAKSRGFKAAAPAAAAGGAAKPNGAANGAAKPAAGAVAAPGALGATPEPSVIDEIRRVQSGQDAALSLSGGGGAPPAALDAVKLANMSQDEFEHMMETLPQHQIDKLMGKK